MSATERDSGSLTRQIDIRRANAADWVSVERVTRAAYAEYATLMERDAWNGLEAAVSDGLAAASGAQVFVAEVAGRVVGSVMLFPPRAEMYGGAVRDSPWHEVRLLAVSPEARGMGVGWALMEECRRQVLAAGGAGIGLHTSRSMAAAMKMYRAMGFERTPEFDFQPAGGELVEAYRLVLAEDSFENRQS